MTPPRVSVVIPSYNRAHCLQHTVASVLSQTVPAYEIIIVDDGSKDDTQEVCRQFTAPVRSIHQKNGGVSAARNTGIAAATGEYVAFLDADDVWLPRKLEVQLAAHAAFPECGWSATDHHTTDIDGQILPAIDGMARTSTVFADVGMEPDVFLAQQLERHTLRMADGNVSVFTGDLFDLAFDGNVIFPSGAMVRRSLIASAGAFDPAFRFAEETEFFHRMAAAAPVIMIRAQLFQWRRGRDDTLVSSTNTAPLIRNALTSLERAAKLRPLTASARQRYDQHKRRLLQKIAYTHLSDLDFDNARKAISEARAAGEPWFPRLLPLYAASHAPGGLLRAAQSFKRKLKGASGS